TYSGFARACCSVKLGVLIKKLLSVEANPTLAIKQTPINPIKSAKAVAYCLFGNWFINKK
ncbi:hypothetical protein ACI4B7_27750, partial [Klebsiella pneumoniae]|uniref:hypothetical protein n=1 Tax=Klebsiella pneumoniae TaxID=573 RepID=UPI0038547F61